MQATTYTYGAEYPFVYTLNRIPVPSQTLWIAFTATGTTADSSTTMWWNASATAVTAESNAALRLSTRSYFLGSLPNVVTSTGAAANASSGFAPAGGITTFDRLIQA